MEMKCNVGSIDRLIRIIAGLLVAIVGVVFDSWWGLVGLIPLATGLFKFCPSYLLFNFSTVEKEQELNH